MIASFPTSTYTPRTKANQTGVVYDALKTTVGYAEDIQHLDAEVVALQTFMRIPGTIPASPVAGSAYFDVATFTLYIYTGTAWKSTILS